MQDTWASARVLWETVQIQTIIALFIYLFIEKKCFKIYILDLHLAYVNLPFITRCCLKKCSNGIPWYSKFSNTYWKLSYIEENNKTSGLRCFDTVFQRPYWYFSIALKVFFSLSDRYKVFTINWLWIEICENVSKIGQ